MKPSMLVQLYLCFNYIVDNPAVLRYLAYICLGTPKNGAPTIGPMTNGPRQMGPDKWASIKMAPRQKGPPSNGPQSKRPQSKGPPSNGPRQNGPVKRSIMCNKRQKPVCRSTMQQSRPTVVLSFIIY